MSNLPAMNETAILELVISDLQEYHNFTMEKAQEQAEDIAECIIEAMWSEYSHVLSECAEGRY